uniref:Uncharacterized protein n=1 Tax=Chromera velia CCMP2878 TaxID=1169474 RepID=A0A0G4F3R0_9ALVE|eukprot:Cvel_2725.t1-p1 / transcript=Cvel_2725.t1 / gene=Cvel_2725 / organism=Chromera_velia_CCMP2878 / gene_product=hypothetical protein / transcript_product=hypothetical protein / location=Cvel_scaffold109:38995-39429(+) / protein_length=145 / sequence_SO=supercontig / SO=protein_coding / is_pseudo=false
MPETELTPKPAAISKKQTRDGSLDWERYFWPGGEVTDVDNPHDFGTYGRVFSSLRDLGYAGEPSSQEISAPELGGRRMTEHVKHAEKSRIVHGKHVHKDRFGYDPGPPNMPSPPPGWQIRFESFPDTPPPLPRLTAAPREGGFFG